MFMEHRRLPWRRLIWLVLMVLYTAPLVAGTTGGITGYVKYDGKLVKGARVTVTSPQLQGTRTSETDEGGFYRIFNLPPGEYQVKAVIPGVPQAIQRQGVSVHIDVTLRVDLSAEKQSSSGPVMTITEAAPVIDVGSTSVGTTFSTSFLNDVPAPRNTTAVLNLAPGAAPDALGTGFRGASSPESNIIIDGVNTTDVKNGLPSTNLPVEFIQDMQVKTDGYEAEYGRATGAVVNVRTKSGGNDVHGTVWTYATPYEATRQESTFGDDPAIAGYDNAVRLTAGQAYDVDVGVEVGGPIVADKIWFWLGAQPNFRRMDYERTIGNTTDNFEAQLFTAQFASKLSFRPNEKQDVSLSFYGNPTRRSGAQNTTAIGYSAERSAIEGYTTAGAFDSSLRWNLEASDATNVEVLFGFHRQLNDLGGNGDNNTATTVHHDIFSPTDSNGDPIQCDNVTDGNGNVIGSSDCQVSGVWRTGGFGGYRNETLQRYTASAQVTHFVSNFVGQHKIKVGGDAEINQVQSERGFYTGFFYDEYAPGGGWGTPGAGFDRRRSFAYSTPVGGGCPNGGTYTEYTDGFTGELAASCILESFEATTSATNFSLFAQDGWSIASNFTVNVGLRWDVQQLRDTNGNVGLGLYDNLAPRAGFIWDPSQAGKSRVFASYGRFYESVPLDLADRSFSAEGTFLEYEDFGTDPPLAILLGGENSPVQDNLKGQFSDEVLLGAEFEVAEDLSVGAKVIHKQLGRVIEDISFDGGSSYAIGNPGTDGSYSLPDETGESQTLAEYRQDGDTCYARYWNEEAGAYDPEFEVPCFFQPTRRYDALEFTAQKRISDNWQMLASYVLSWTQGNYPGLFTPENGQLNPNITSQFDIADLLVNRSGYLPQDRRHAVKFHGSYQTEKGLVGGLALAAFSGTPYSYLGSDEQYGYGNGEVFLAPRGTAGRLPWQIQLDGNLAYRYALENGRDVTLSVAAFNLLNVQRPTAVDENWTFDSSVATEGADSEDDFQCDSDGDGAFSNEECTKNVNFGQATTYQRPLNVRAGLKMTF